MEELLRDSRRPQGGAGRARPPPSRSARVGTEMLPQSREAISSLVGSATRTAPRPTTSTPPWTALRPSSPCMQVGRLRPSPALAKTGATTETPLPMRTQTPTPLTATAPTRATCPRPATASLLSVARLLWLPLSLPRLRHPRFATRRFTSVFSSFVSVCRTVVQKLGCLMKGAEPGDNPDSAPSRSIPTTPERISFLDCALNDPELSPQGTVQTVTKQSC